MKKILIIGGLGNIGLGVTKAYKEAGYEVTVLSRTGAETAKKLEVDWIGCDRNNEEAFCEAIGNSGFEYAVDMCCFTAEQAGIVYKALPELRQLIAVSTGAAYGPLYGTELPIREDMKLSPKWQYGVIKKGMEEFFMNCYREKGYPVTILRPSVTYGRQKTIVRQITAENSWIDRIRKGKPIVTGNPFILRSFLFVDDAAQAFVGAMNHACCIGQTYNLVGRKPDDWGSYHRAMMKVLGREVEMVEVPLDVMKACPDFEVSEMITESYVFNAYYSGEKIARDIPEFSPKTPLEEGLVHAVEFLDQNHLIPNSDELSWEDDLIRAQQRAVNFWMPDSISQE